MKKLFFIPAVLFLLPFCLFESTLYYYTSDLPFHELTMSSPKIPEKIAKIYAQRFNMDSEKDFNKIGVSDLIYEIVTSQFYNSEQNYELGNLPSFTYGSSTHGGLLANKLSWMLVFNYRTELPFDVLNTIRFYYFTTVWISRNLTVKQALTYYIQHDLLGHDAIGIENASKLYFDKTPSQLNNYEIQILNAMSAI